MTRVSTDRKPGTRTRPLNRILLFLIIYFVVGLMPLYFLFTLALEALNQEAGKRLQIAATVGAQFIDGDAHARIKTVADTEQDNYHNVKAQMRKILHAFPDARIVHVYSLRQNPEQTDKKYGTFFVVDSAHPDDFPFMTADDIAAFGDPYCLGPGMITAFAGEPAATDFLYGNQCGTWRTGYAPIRTSEGTIDAILCVDGATHDTLAQMERLHMWGIFSIMSSLVFLLLLTIILGVREARPDQALKN